MCTGRSGRGLEKTIWILPFVWTAGGEYGSYFVDGSDCLSSNTASDEEREGEWKGKERNWRREEKWRQKQ